MDIDSSSRIGSGQTVGPSEERWKEKQLYQESVLLLAAAVKALEDGRSQVSAPATALVCRFCAALRMISRLPQIPSENEFELEQTLHRGMESCLCILRETSMNSWEQRAAITEWIFSLSESTPEWIEKILREEHFELALQTLRQGLHRTANVLDPSLGSIEDPGLGFLHRGYSCAIEEYEAGRLLWKRCATLLARLADLASSGMHLGERQQLQAVFVAQTAIQVTDTIADGMRHAAASSSAPARREMRQFLADVWTAAARILGATYAYYAQYRRLVVDEAHILLRSTRQLDLIGWQVDPTTSPVPGSRPQLGKYPPVELLTTLLDVISLSDLPNLIDGGTERLTSSSEVPADSEKRTAKKTSGTSLQRTTADELQHAAVPFLETAWMLLSAYLPEPTAAFRSISKNRLLFLLHYLEQRFRDTSSPQPIPFILLQLLIHQTLKWTISLEGADPNDSLQAAERCLRIANLIHSLVNTKQVATSSSWIGLNPDHLRNILVAEHPLWFLLLGLLEAPAQKQALDTDEASMPPAPKRHQMGQPLSWATIIQILQKTLHCSLRLLRNRALALLQMALGSSRATFRARAARLFGEMSHLSTPATVQQHFGQTEWQAPALLQRSVRDTHSAPVPWAPHANESAEADKDLQVHDMLCETPDSTDTAQAAFIDKAIALATACCLDVSPRVRESALVPYVSWMRLSGKPMVAYTTLFSRLCDVSIGVRQRAIQTLDSLLWEKEVIDSSDWSLAAAHLFLRLDDPATTIRQLAQRALYAHIFHRQLAHQEVPIGSNASKHTTFDFGTESAEAVHEEALVTPGQPLRRRRQKLYFLDDQRDWHWSPLKRPNGPGHSSAEPFHRILLVQERLARELPPGGSTAVFTLMKRFLLIDERIVGLTRAEAEKLASILMTRQAYTQLAVLAHLDASLAAPLLPLLIREIHSLATEMGSSSFAVDEQKFIWMIRILSSCSRVLGRERTESQLWLTLERSVARLVFHLPLHSEFLASEAVLLLRALHDHHTRVASRNLQSAAYWQRVEHLWDFVERLWTQLGSSSTSPQRMVSENDGLDLALRRLGKLIRYAPAPVGNTAARLEELHEKLHSRYSVLQTVSFEATSAAAFRFQSHVLSVLECLLQLTFCNEKFALKQLPLWLWSMSLNQHPNEAADQILSPRFIGNIQERLLGHLVEFIQHDRYTTGVFDPTAYWDSAMASAAGTDGVRRALRPGCLRVEAISPVDGSADWLPSTESTGIAAVDISEKQSNVIFGLVQTIMPSVLSVFNTACLPKTSAWLTSAARLCYVAMIDGILLPDSVITPLCCIFWTSWKGFEGIKTPSGVLTISVDRPGDIAAQALHHLVIHETSKLAAELKCAFLTAWRCCRNERMPLMVPSGGISSDPSNADHPTDPDKSTASIHSAESEAILRLNLQPETDEHICGFLYTRITEPVLRQRVLHDLVSVLTASPLDKEYSMDTRCSVALFLATVSFRDVPQVSQRASREEVCAVIETLECHLSATENALEQVFSLIADDNQGTPQELIETNVPSCRCLVLQLQLVLLLQAQVIASRPAPWAALRDMVAAATTPCLPALFDHARAYWRQWQEQSPLLHRAKDEALRHTQLVNESSPEPDPDSDNERSSATVETE
jgi:hypothetical protein